MKHVFLLGFLMIVLLSCGEETKPTPTEKKITPATVNAGQLIPMVAGNKWVYDAWERKYKKDFELTCELHFTWDYLDKVTGKEFERFAFQFENNINIGGDVYIYDLGYCYSVHGDTVIKLDWSEKRDVLYYPFVKPNPDGEKYGFHAWIKNYKVNGYTFDLVHVYKNNISGLETYLYYKQGIGLVHCKSTKAGTLTHEYKIKSATLK